MRKRKPSPEASRAGRALAVHSVRSRMKNKTAVERSEQGRMAVAERWRRWRAARAEGGGR